MLDQDFITVENYEEIALAIEPLINKYIRVWSFEFKRDQSDIREDINMCLMDTIKKFKKNKCSFESFFIMRIRHMLFNIARKTYRERVCTNPQASEPCHVCNKRALCSGTCRYLATFKQGRKEANAIKNILENQREFTDDIMEQDHANKILKMIPPEHQELIEAFKDTIEKGSEKILIDTRNRWMKEKGISKQFFYDKIKRLRKMITIYDAQLGGAL